MSGPATDLLAFLAGAGLSLTVGTNAFRGLVQPVGEYVPADALFAADAGGPAPSARDMGGSGESRIAMVVLRLRWTDAIDGDTKIHAVRDALTGAAVAGYLDTVAAGEPRELPNDENGRSMWMLGVRMVKNATA